MNIPPSRDPATRLTINPLVANAMNPRIVSSLDPRLSPNRNPFEVPELNPRATPEINPAEAENLNYKVNDRINPAVSPGINPSTNPSINPNVAPGIDGLYVFNLKRDPVGFIIPVNEQVSLSFASGCKFGGVLVHVRDDFMNEFNHDNEWIGFWLYARRNTWLRFDLKKDWTGFST